MNHIAIRWASALVLCMLLASAHLLDGPSDTQAAADVAADVQDAQAQAQAARHHATPSPLPTHPTRHQP